MKRDRWQFMLALSATALAACERDEIAHYRVPKSEARPGASSPHDGAAIRRMLAAIVPHGERTWFFKLEGSDDAVGRQHEAFDRFIRSIRFDAPGGEEIAWTAPEGWRRKPASGIRYATLLIGSEEAPLELTVTPLGREAGAVLPNVNRWRDQLGLPPIGEADLAKVATTASLVGTTATIVDLTGPGASASAPRAPFAGTGRGAQTEERAPEAPRYELPPGWESTEPGAMSLAAFRVSEGSLQAKVTIASLPGPAGGLLANVNRWRGQIILGPATDEEVRQMARPIEVDGAAASYLDMVGPQQRILGVVQGRGERTWFFKMQGPTELVEKQKPAFEAFVRSVEF